MLSQGTNYEKAQECIRKAEEAEARATRIRRHTEAYYQPQTYVDYVLSKDPDYKGAVADNQWYIQQAQMYAAAAALEQRPPIRVEANVGPPLQRGQHVRS